MKIVLQLPQVRREKFTRPWQCPYCKGTVFQRWGLVSRQIKDTKVRKIKVPRYKCTSCGRTFRSYPEGISHAQQSERLMKLCVIMWSLGLSHMSGWRDVQREGKRIRQQLKWKGARVVGVDGAWIAGKGIMVAVDLGDGELLAIAEIDEKEKVAVEAWLKALKQKHKIGAIVTDDLSNYKEIADELGLGHQICQFHVKRWVGRALKNLEKELPPEWLFVIPKRQDLLQNLPANGSKTLYELWREMPGRTTKSDEKRTPLEKLRDLVLRLCRDWNRYVEFYSDPGIPWTNNRTEQMIGRLKNRAKRVWEYKTSKGQIVGSLVAAQFWT